MSTKAIAVIYGNMFVIFLLLQWTLLKKKEEKKEKEMRLICSQLFVKSYLTFYVAEVYNMAKP